MKTGHRRFDLWTVASIALFLMFLVFLIYPLFGVMKQSIVGDDGKLTFSQFAKFLGQSLFLWYDKYSINS